MTPESAAAVLNGNQYRNEGSKELFESMRIFGLVAVFGGSDDLMEFRGAIDDEVGAPGTSYFTKTGLLQSDCIDDECPYFAKIKAKAATVTAKGHRDFQFIYETDIPHAKFLIEEDGENYCEGIVFALADVPAGDI